MAKKTHPINAMGKYENKGFNSSDMLIDPIAVSKSGIKKTAKMKRNEAIKIASNRILIPRDYHHYPRYEGYHYYSGYYEKGYPSHIRYRKHRNRISTYSQP